MIHMEYYLVVSTIMMFAGIYGFFTRRNTLAILISVELMLNATDINFAVFNRFLFPEGMEGYFFALFSIAISAAETAVAIAIMINIYRNLRSIHLHIVFVHCYLLLYYNLHFVKHMLVLYMSLLQIPHIFYIFDYLLKILHGLL